MRYERISKVILFFLFMGIYLPATAIAGNKEHIDQHQPNDINEFRTVNINVIVGQTFQPAFKGRLTRVALKLNKVLGYSIDNTPIYPGDLMVEIRTTISNLVPTEEVIATASVKELMITNEMPQWYEVIFENPPALSSNTTYAMVVRAMEEIPSGLEGTRASYSVYYNADNFIDPYPSGMLMGRQAVDSYLNWFSWIDWNFMDAAFVTYMTRGMN